MNATRLNDCCTGHDACPPRALITASTDTFINGKGAGRVGDLYAAHECLEHPTHNDYIASVSSSVMINGRPAARVGDAVSIGGNVMEGSEDVLIG